MSLLHVLPQETVRIHAACCFQLWFYLAWLLLLWFAWVPFENARAMMFVEKPAVAAVPAYLWKDLVSTEWLWPFLPDIYQSKRRWELSSYIFGNTVAGFASIVWSSQQRRVLRTLGSCGCRHCHIGAVVAGVVGWRSCGCTRCAGAVGAAPFALSLVRSTPKLIKHRAWSGCTLRTCFFFGAGYFKIR